MILDLKNILWSTRGQNWGFRFLLKPSEYRESKDWLSHYEKMFKSSSIDEIAIDSGMISIDNNTIPYIALRFLDPEGRKDTSGRIIPHEIALLGERNQKLKNQNLEDLRNSVWKQISSSYELLYLLREADIKEKEVTISCEAIEVKQKVKSDSKNQSGVSKRNFSIAVVILLLIITIALIMTHPPKETQPPKAEQDRNLTKTTNPQTIQTTETLVAHDKQESIPSEKPAPLIKRQAPVMPLNMNKSS